MNGRCLEQQAACHQRQHGLMRPGVTRLLHAQSVGLRSMLLALSKVVRVHSSQDSG